MCLPAMVEAMVSDKKITGTTGIENIHNLFVVPEGLTDSPGHRPQAKKRLRRPLDYESYPNRITSECAPSYMKGQNWPPDISRCQDLSLK